MGKATHNPQVLILGGSGETEAVLSLFVGSHIAFWRAPTSLPVAVENPTGDLRQFLADPALAAVRHVLDVSHGFDHAISAELADFCAQRRLLYVYLRRPAWLPQRGDTWTTLQNMAEARDAIAGYGRVFTNVGRGLLEGLKGHPGELLVRQTTRHSAPPPFDGLRYVFGTPPFSQADEVALFASLEVEAVLFRNTGGGQGVSKLEAARALGLPMIMLSRPAAPLGKRLHSVAEVRAWAAGLGVLRDEKAAALERP